MQRLRLVNTKPDLVEHFIDRSENKVTVHIEVMFWNVNQHNQNLARIVATRYYNDGKSIVVTTEEDAVLKRSIAEQTVREHQLNNRMHHLLLENPRHQEQFSMFFDMRKAYEEYLTLASL